MTASVGIVGLGKLGLPTAITMSQGGYLTRGYDIDASRMALARVPPYELDADCSAPLSAQLGADLPLRFCPMAEVVNESDCVLVAVETPHRPEHEGSTPLPQTRADFSYDALSAALSAIVRVAERPVEIGVISTVLPGTVRGALLPFAGGHSLVYCPQFVAMGTVARDLRYPEFTLLGYSDAARASAPTSAVRAVLEGIRLQDAPTLEMSYESAELAKVVYNTFVTAKITVANVVQQLAQMTGASAADVFGVLRSAGQRLASPSYLGPGMGDGGPCHPRDNIALSWLAGQLGLRADLFTALMRQREAYVEWLGQEFAAAAGGRPKVLLGAAYKPGVPLETGSSALLLAHVMAADGQPLTTVRDVAELRELDLGDEPGAFFLGCPSPEFLAYRFPPGSVVLDPWHRLEPTEGVTVRYVGEQR